MKSAEVAVALSLGPDVTVTGVPTAAPPVAQPAALVSGPQTENVTVPPGVPATVLPASVTSSWLAVPTGILALTGLEDVPALAAVTVKHSSLVPSLDGL
jgi:hypothetical protein